MTIGIHGTATLTQDSASYPQIHPLARRPRSGNLYRPRQVQADLNAAGSAAGTFTSSALTLVNGTLSISGHATLADTGLLNRRAGVSFAGHASDTFTVTRQVQADLNAAASANVAPRCVIGLDVAVSILGSASFSANESIGFQFTQLIIIGNATGSSFTGELVKNEPSHSVQGNRNIRPANHAQRNRLNARQSHGKHLRQPFLVYL